MVIITVSVQPTIDIATVLSVVMLHGTYSVRSVSISFVIERTIATIRSDIYEREAYFWCFIWLPIVLIVFTVRLQ